LKNPEGAIESPVFSIGNIPIHGDLILAPMDGFTDWPFRTICRELGSAMTYTEFINVDELAFARKPESPARLKLKFSETERPVAVQIYGHVVERLVETARAIQDEFHPDIIDINLGCAIRKIAERGAGSGMLKDPGKIGRLFAALTAALRLPVTAKIRLGWDAGTRNYLAVASALEENGCALIAVHARTKEQALSGPVDWPAIGEIKSRVRIPILGNGNVDTISDSERMKRETGCDGVMIGRAAIGNPWIFARRDREEVTLAESVAMARRHLGLMVDLYGPRFGSIIFRKHAVRYVHHLRSVRELRTRLVLCTNVEEYELLFEKALAIEAG
jgi:tRNA-dihydrouridine synthase B